MSPPSVFTYFGEPDGSGRVANLRFYFSTDALLGEICPCGVGFSSVWVSDPVSVDLEALKSGAATLTVAMDPAQWIDLESNRGDVDPAHLDYFADAVADVDTIGLTFGGGQSVSAGAGIAPGSGAGSFHLLDFTALSNAD